MQNELTAERIEKAVDSIEQHKDRMEMFVALAAEPEKTYKDTILYCDALVTALAALRAEQDRLNPQPLAWEELSDMVGEPVWTIGERCGLDGWDIIEEVYEDSILFGRSTERPVKWRYNLRKLSGELSGCAWLAYRTKPEGSAE